MFILALAATATPSPRIQDASASSRSQCVAFSWISDNAKSPKGAISVPVVVNGKTLSVQLGAGADATILYGNLAARAG